MSVHSRISNRESLALAIDYHSVHAACGHIDDSAMDRLDKPRDVLALALLVMVIEHELSFMAAAKYPASISCTNDRMSMTQHLELLVQILPLAGLQHPMKERVIFRDVHALVPSCAHTDDVHSRDQPKPSCDTNAAVCSAARGCGSMVLSQGEPAANCEEGVIGCGV